MLTSALRTHQNDMSLAGFVGEGKPNGSEDYEEETDEEDDTQPSDDVNDAPRYVHQAHLKHHQNVVQNRQLMCPL